MHEDRQATETRVEKAQALRSDVDRTVKRAEQYLCYALNKTEELLLFPIFVCTLTDNASRENLKVARCIHSAEYTSIKCIPLVFPIRIDSIDYGDLFSGRAVVESYHRHFDLLSVISMYNMAISYVCLAEHEAISHNRSDVKVESLRQTALTFLSSSSSILAVKGRNHRPRVSDVGLLDESYLDKVNYLSIVVLSTRFLILNDVAMFDNAAICLSQIFQVREIIDQMYLNAISFNEAAAVA